MVRGYYAKTLEALLPSPAPVGRYWRWSLSEVIVIGVALIVLPHVGIKLTSTVTGDFCVEAAAVCSRCMSHKQSVHFRFRRSAECHDCRHGISSSGESMKAGSQQRSLPGIYRPLD